MAMEGNAPAPEFVLDDVLRVLRADGTAQRELDPGLSDAQAVALLERMLFTRLLDERLVALQRQGRIGFHIGSMGEEATVLGSAAALREQDWIFPCYREFGALLLRGLPLQRYLDNMYGNANDPVKGRQMPDHYTDRAHHFGSVSSPIGTQMTQAVGFAWAAKLKRDPLVTLAYFGEGSTSSSEFHAAANFAGVFKTPTILLCRNNGWAISVPAERQTASKTFAQKAFAYGITPVRVDGNDLLAMRQVTAEAVARARRGDGPTLIEAVTFRMGGHSTSDDPTRYVPKELVESWAKKDPVARFERFLEKQKLWTKEQGEALYAAAVEQVTAAVKEAEGTPPPKLESIFTDVFATVPQHLRRQGQAAFELAARKGDAGAGDGKFPL